MPRRGTVTSVCSRRGASRPWGRSKDFRSAPFPKTCTRSGKTYRRGRRTFSDLRNRRIQQWRSGSMSVWKRPRADEKGAPKQPLKSVEAAVQFAAPSLLNVLRLDAYKRGQGLRPPAARRYGTCKTPGRAPSTATPSRHRSTRSINASLSNPNVDCQQRATPGRRTPAAAAHALTLPRSIRKMELELPRFGGRLGAWLAS